jgi:hypothetical protein
MGGRVRVYDTVSVWTLTLTGTSGDAARVVNA